MSLHVTQFVKAAALVTAVLYLLCYAFVVAAPELAMEITGHMLHMDLSGSTWSTSGMGLVMGLVCMAGTMSLIAWSFGTTYNLFVESTARTLTTESER